MSIYDKIVTWIRVLFLIRSRNSNRWRAALELKTDAVVHSVTTSSSTYLKYEIGLYLNILNSIQNIKID